MTSPPVSQASVGVVAAESPSERLRAFAREHDVRWRRAAQVTDAFSDAPVQFGFTLELHAAHVRPKHPPHPGCDECVELYEGLADIARAVIPRVNRPTQYEIRPFRGELVFAPTRGGRDEVVLALDVAHKNGLGPVDDCERLCVAEIEAALLVVGAKRL